MIDRRVRVVGPHTAEVSEGRFSSFNEVRNLVLLGDPGAGKTTVLREAGGEDAYITTRSFLNRQPAHLAPVLFIDALDEQRAGGKEDTVVDSIVQKLLACPHVCKIRISCRVQDWLGGTDLAGFNDYFRGNGGVTVLALLPLDDHEQVEILSTNDVSPQKARQFLDEAVRRGLVAFTRNPRTMLMLHQVVSDGAWPTTMAELLDRATRLQLTEHNQQHARTAGGNFTAQELRSTAGGICAVRLLADIEGISLTGHEPAAGFPSYRELQHLESERVLAALRRPLFVPATLTQCVDYDHRTSAEFLAAEWIAAKVQGGLPVGRVVALLGVDGRPASELRGLHAWLPFFLRDHAERFIAADPLGVVEYGDPASFPISARRMLLAELEVTAKQNPWFLAHGREPKGLGCLVQDDLVDTLRRMLEDPIAPRDLRKIAFRAFEAAVPKGEAFAPLLAASMDETLSWGDRSDALAALVTYGKRGDDAILAALSDLRGSADDRLQLRAAAIEHLYGRGLGAEDVVGLVHDLLAVAVDCSIVTLWKLADNLPLPDVCRILDDLVSMPPPVTRDHRRAESNAASLITRLVLRVGKEMPHALTPTRALAWLGLRHRLDRLGSARRDQALVAAIRGVSGLVLGMFNEFVDELSVDEKRWRQLRRFNEMIGVLGEADSLCAWSLARLDSESEPMRRTFLFEVGMQLWRDQALYGQRHCELLYELGQRDATLTEVMQHYLIQDLAWWYADGPQRAAENRRDQRVADSKTREAFTESREQVREGKALGHLAFAAKVYWHRADSESDASPTGRLVVRLGEDNAAVVLEGFNALLITQTPPSIDEIYELRAQGKYREWWHALVAGADASRRRGDDLATLSEGVVTAVLSIDLIDDLSRPTERSGEFVPSLQEHLRALFPAIAVTVYLRAIEFDLERGKEHVTGLYHLLRKPEFREARRGALLSILARFPVPYPANLKQLIQAALAEPDLKEGLAHRAGEALTDARLSAEHLCLWRAAGFVLRPQELREELRTALVADPVGIWALRDCLGEGRDPEDAPVVRLGVAELQFLIAVNGMVWPFAHHPETTWGGNTNPWDASDFVLRLVGRLAKETVAEATQALMELATDPTLGTYRDHCRLALEQHRIARREAEYARPNWQRVLKTLANGAPANAADLHALVLDHVHDLACQVHGSNLDLFKQFWNETPHGKPERPKPEESCRDVFLGLLRPLLRPLGLSAEPEGHMVGDKRVDIVVAAAGIKLVIEVKLSHSKDLWTAMTHQLDERYTCDPDTKGFGILLVLWFGNVDKQRVKVNPATRLAPANASDLEVQLNAEIPASAAHRLAAVVVPVTGRQEQSR